MKFRIKTRESVNRLPEVNEYFLLDDGDDGNNLYRRVSDSDGILHFPKLVSKEYIYAYSFAYNTIIRIKKEQEFIIVKQISGAEFEIL